MVNPLKERISRAIMPHMESAPTESEKFYKPGDAAEMLHISTATLRAWAAAGKIEQTKTPGGHRRYSAQAIADAQAMMQSEQRSLTRSGVDAAHKSHASADPHMGNLMPGEGVTYIVDHYAVLGVDQSATQEQIVQAWRRANKDYHPDRYAHLAPDMQRSAAAKNLRIRRSYDVLNNREARAAYDEQLNAWDGPISTNGHEIIVVGAAGILGRHAFGSDSWRELEQKRAMTLAAIGYDDAVYEMLAEQAQAADEAGVELPPKIRQAWSDTLARRDQYLALKMGFDLDDLGDQEAVGNSVDENYPALISARVAKACDRLTTALAKQLPALAEHKLLESGEANAPQGEQTASKDLILSKMLSEATEQIEQARVLIEKAAVERVQLADQRMDLIVPVYQPEQQNPTPRIVLELNIYGKAQKIGFVMAGDNANQSDELTAMANDLDFDDLAACQTLVDQGISVLRYTRQDGLDVMQEMACVLGAHAERLAEVHPSLNGAEPGHSL